MKNILFLFAFFIFFFSCEKKETITIPIPKKIDGFLINGTIESFNNKMVYLQRQNIDKSYHTVDSTLIANNKFSFKGEDSPVKLYYVGFQNNTYKIPIIANNFETFIMVNSTDLEKTTIIGSDLQNDYLSYLTDLAKAKNKFVFKIKYIEKNPKSVLSAIVLEQMLGKTKWRLDQNRKAFNLLSATIQNTAIGKEIDSFISLNEPLVAENEVIAEISLNPDISNEKQIIPIIEKPVKKVVKKTPKRRKAPNFSAESINGNDITLKSITKNAKVTLIDFWASWCGPCRKQNPHLIQLYNRYHSKGFDIIGISEDKYKDLNKWKNAVAVDGLPWHQVIDDNNRLANMFGVSGIPHTVLLDSNGGIIFAKKSSYTIEQKLKEIFD
jgi:thiol-disulfide isomerase/thioredoxin